MATNTTIKSKSGTEYGYCRITKTIGHKYVNGKKTGIRKTFYGTSKKNAERKYEEWLKERDKVRKNIIDESKSLGELMDYYCENILMINSDYEVTTRDQYREAYRRYIKDSDITTIPIADLKSEHLQFFYNDLKTSETMMTKIHCFIKGFFNWGVSNKYCFDLLSGIIVPDKKLYNQKDDEDDKIVIWSDNEIERIMNCEPNHKFKPLLIFALYSGMRISEIFGLKWKDLKNDTIYVRRQYCRGHWKDPKQNEKREIPMHPKIKDCLKQLDHSCELVFHNNGEPLIYATVTNNLNRFYTRNGIPHKKFHAYRSTFCTNLCKKGVPIQTTAKLAGHKSIEVTAKYYAAVNKEEKIDAISKL